MLLRRTPLAIAVSLAALSSVAQAQEHGSTETFDHVPYYQYIYFTEDEFARFEGTDHHANLGEYTNGKYLTVDRSQNNLDDPLFLVVGTQLDSAYDRQNPTEIWAENREAIEVDGGTWQPALIANSGFVNAYGVVTPPDSEISQDDADSSLYGLINFVEDGEGNVIGWQPQGVLISGAELIGLTADDADAAKVSSLGLFASGEERVALFNSGYISSEGHAILALGDDEDSDWRPRIVGSIVNQQDAEDNGGGIYSHMGRAILLAAADMEGNIVNASGTQMLGGTGVIGIEAGSTFQGAIHNHGLMDTWRGSVIRIRDSHFDGQIINHAGGEMYADGEEAAIDIRNVSGGVFIDQRGHLQAGGYIIDHDTTDSSLSDNLAFVDIGQAMHLQGSNIHARLSAGSVIGDIDFEGATVTLAGGEYQGTISNRGGTFVVEGIHAIDGSYEQDADATLRFASHTLSGLTAERITLADGSTIEFGNGKAYRDGKQLVALEAEELDFDLASLNLVAGSGLYRISKVEESADGRRLLVTYAGLDGEEIARRAIDASNATGAQARQLQGLGNALNRVLANSADEAAVLALIEAIGDGSEIDQLLPDTSGAVAGGTASASQASSNAVSVRARGVAAGDALANQGIWVKGLYSEIDQRARDGVQGFDSDTRGFVLGGDIELHNGTVLGLAWSRTRTDVDGKNGLTRSEIDFDQLAAYAGRAYGNWLFDAQLAYGWGDNDTSRRVLGSTARADFDSEQFSAVAAAAYEYRLDDATRLTPRLSATYANLELDAYEERGAGALNLRQDDQRFERFELGLEGELAHTLPLGSLLAEPRLTLGVFHDLQGKARSNVNAFAFAPEETFSVEGPKPDKTRYSAGLGIDLYSEGGVTTSVDYDYGWSSSMSSHAGSLRVRYDF